MKLSKAFSITVVTGLGLILSAALPVRLFAVASRSGATQWSVQVEPVGAGDVSAGPAFEMAIYENLLKEVQQTKQFEQVLRSGDQTAKGIPNLLILKTTVMSYTEGSETRRAVTTFGGATKLMVQSQLCTRDGHVVLDRELNGNVRFFGDNLKATHNLARHVADAIKKSTLPEPTDAVLHASTAPDASR